MDLSQKKAKHEYLPYIIKLLHGDALGQIRKTSVESDIQYKKAFEKIDINPNQHLILVENDKNIIAICHLTIMPSLIFKGRACM